jgi:hypothetical protein
MSEESHREELLLHTVTRAMALRDVVAVLLAMQATSIPDPKSLFRTISDGLDARLDEMKTSDRHMAHVERIRSEFDWILNMARRLSGTA